MTVQWRGADTGLDAVRAGDVVTLHGGAAPVSYDVVHVAGPCWQLRHADTTHVAHVAKSKAGTWVHVDGRTHVIVAEAQASTAAHDGDGSLVAPMTGKILEVPVAQGAHVEAGAVVVVLSAMKMRIELKAPFAGVVCRVNVRAGEQVEGGTLLAVVEPGTAS